MVSVGLTHAFVSPPSAPLILAAHSMEEAEQLCDRLGIFVDGQFQCIGNPKELTARYGGTYVLTITTPPEQEAAVGEMVKGLSPNAKCVYALSGTQKFELPTSEVSRPVLSTVWHCRYCTVL